jgi:arylsulfatase A-like enzyme
MVPLLHRGGPPPPWRAALLVEQDEVRFRPGEAVPPRSVLEPLDLQEEEMREAARRERAAIPAYNALRTATHTYVVYSTGERELYDLRSDPYELQNLARTADAALLARLNSWLDAFRKCRGAECRSADLEPPQ